MLIIDINLMIYMYRIYFDKILNNPLYCKVEILALALTRTPMVVGLRKPFVYFSEAILTPTRTAESINKLCGQLNGQMSLSSSLLWEMHALSVKRQAQLFTSTGFKGESWFAWLTSTIDGVAESITFPDAKSRKRFCALLMHSISSPKNYYVAEETRELINQLNANKIQWGILSNENHQYKSILDRLDIFPPNGPFLNATNGKFKPIPKVWDWAISKVPAASKYDVWFVGSNNSPCDRMCKSDKVRCVLVDENIPASEEVSTHFKVKSIGDLAPLFIPQVTPNLSFLNDIPDDESDDVILTTYPAQKLPPKSEPDLGLAHLNKD